MRLIKLTYLGSLVFLIACSGKEEKPVVHDIESVIGEVGAMEADTAEEEITSELDLSSSYGGFVNSQLDLYDTLTLDERHLMDRFSFSKRQRVLFKGKENVPYGRTGTATPTAQFYFYTFADSVKTNNAFYNYLDGMAEEGEGGPVKLNQDVEAIKMPPMQMFVYDTVIVSVHYTCEAVANDWEPFQDSILFHMGENYRYRFDVDCGGPLNWKTND